MVSNISKIVAVALQPCNLEKMTVCMVFTLLLVDNEGTFDTCFLKMPF